MKIKTILICLGFFSSVNSFAQFAVGAKGGINFNSFVGDRAYDVIPGFNVGGFVEHPILNFLNARAELLYFQQGGNLYDYQVIPPELQHNNAKLIFHNIQVPVLAEFGLPALNDEPLQPKLLLGAFYSYSFAIRDQYVNYVKVGGYEPVEYKGTADVANDFYRNQFGLIGGIAAEIEIGTFPVSLEFRYHYNLNPVNRPDSSGKYYLKNTTAAWGDNLKIATLSINAAVTLKYF
ncbi:MAG TPA: porin family protein [Cyclobacteriaceae bacterium]|jgi:hypothetical protein|nr:porin family protein [Cyclobacteriaceae bacterium]